MRRASVRTKDAVHRVDCSVREAVASDVSKVHMLSANSCNANGVIQVVTLTVVVQSIVEAGAFVQRCPTRTVVSSSHSHDPLHLGRSTYADVELSYEPYVLQGSVGLKHTSFRESMNEYVGLPVSTLSQIVCGGVPT